MGKIKKILENELVGGTQSTDARLKEKQINKTSNKTTQK